MAGEIIEGMLEVPSGIVVPGMVVVEKDISTVAQEYFALWNGVYEDPQTIRIVTPARTEGRVTHRTEQDTRLKVVSETINRGAKKNIMEMIVLHPDTDMSIAVNLSESIPNLADDPYAQLIMDIFRSHLAA